MASAGANYKHVSHVSTQLPYATTAAVAAAIAYVIAGFTSTPVIPLVVGIVVLIGSLFFFRSREGSYRISDAANTANAQK
jgi:Na+/H+ antiporter NhaC